MKEHIYLITLGIAFGTVVLVFAFRAIASVQQAKARIAAEMSYRGMAENGMAAQAKLGLALAGIEASMTDVQARLASIERILKDVE